MELGWRRTVNFTVYQNIHHKKLPIVDIHYEILICPSERRDLIASSPWNSRYLIKYIVLLSLSER